MNSTAYFHGICITSALLAAEHLALYTILARYPLVKFILGTLAILIGCAVIGYEANDWTVLLAPASCAIGGGAIVAAGYAGRWLYGRAISEAETRGWLKGLADKGDING